MPYFLSFWYSDLRGTPICRAAYSIRPPRANSRIAKFPSPKQLPEMNKRMTRQRRAFVAPPRVGYGQIS